MKTLQERCKWPLGEQSNEYPKGPSDSQRPKEKGHDPYRELQAKKLLSLYVFLLHGRNMESHLPTALFVNKCSSGGVQLQLQQVEPGKEWVM
ncbi:hypothetical protein P7K49_029046 [Saguinus oedipus]|uniref:Uncharacterized protein n=1 Tax=Saguinus oedipus TaxID=9490 RepID=A0ABQ9U630_SAGOE|nr:hypothetical protein P7K49_029046 [Saguinus oedipus]